MADMIQVFMYFIFRMTDNNQIRWAPLESNPTVFTDYIHKLGVKSTWVINIFQ